MNDSLPGWSFRAGDHLASGLVALKKLGGGNAYEAYAAFDERLYAPVVVKVVRPDQVQNANTLATLRREVEMLQRLNHPAIVRMYSVCLTGERPHLVLENIDGPNLSALIVKHGALPLPQLLPLGIEIASALHYLRSVDICHLDIKPSNIIMGAPVRLIDMSCARDRAAAIDLNEPIGTDQYMAPEQCEPGVRSEIGFAADTWGLGTTMFRAATGHRAFDHRQDRFAQLRQRPRPLLGSLTPSLSDLILSCLEHDAGNRPEPAEFADALEPMMANLPTSRLSGFKISL